MRHSAATGASAPDREATNATARSLAILVTLLLLAFIAALAVQAETRRRDLTADLIARNVAAVEIAAAHADARFAKADAANAAAAALMRRGDAALAGAAVEVARAEGVAAAAVVARGGQILAANGRAEPGVIAAAAAATPASGAWTGVAPGSRTPRLATARAAGGLTIVSIIDPALLAPPAPARARVFVAASDGRLLFAMPRAARASEADAAAIIAAAPNPGGATARTADGQVWSIASARAADGAAQIVIAAPAPSPADAILAALVQMAMLAGAPMAAVAVLLLLLRQHARRAARAEAEAERAETQFRLAADGAHAGVFEWRAGADLVTLSEQAAKLIHVNTTQMPLADFVALAVPEDRAALEEEFRAAGRSGAFDAHYRIAHGASLVWLEARGVVVEEDPEAGPLRLMGTIVDVSHRQEAQARVVRLERQLRAAIDSFTGPFALWDARRRLMLWNQAFAQAFDLGPELLRPRVSYEAVALASTARIKRERVDPVDSQIREIELASGEWLQIVERRTGDGGLVTVGLDITPLKRQEQALTRNDKRLRELVQRLEKSEAENKVLARQADEERRKAEDASKAKSAFLANMSHELRTPLNAIIGFSEIMSKELFGPIGNEQYKQYSGDIFSSGNHLLDMINDILDMAKIEAGKINLSPRVLDPMVAIDQAVRLTKRRADEKGLHLMVDAEGVPEIEADHRAVKQMLINLLSNALKFTDSGAIVVRARPTSDGLVLRVIDTGCGIPADQLPRLARPFEQVEATLARNHSGTGLGLALTKSLAEMHGGRLDIQSTVGEGTIVSVYLPAVFGGERAAPGEEAGVQEAARTAAE